MLTGRWLGLDLRGESRQEPACSCHLADFPPSTDVKQLMYHFGPAVNKAYILAVKTILSTTTCSNPKG